MKHVVHRSLPWLGSVKHRPWTSYARTVATQASIQDVEQSKKKATNRQHWQPHEVSVLIAAKKKQLESEAVSFGSSGKSKEQWEEIEAFCQNNGIERNAQQCRDKWQRLIRIYSKVDDWEKKRSPDKLSYWQMKLDERRAEGLQFGFDRETFDALKELHSNAYGTKSRVEEFAESKGIQSTMFNVCEVQQLEGVAKNFPSEGILEHGDKETDGWGFEELEDTVLPSIDRVGEAGCTVDALEVGSKDAQRNLINSSEGISESQTRTEEGEKCHLEGTSGVAGKGSGNVHEEIIHKADSNVAVSQIAKAQNANEIPMINLQASAEIQENLVGTAGFQNRVDPHKEDENVLSLLNGSEESLRNSISEKDQGTLDDRIKTINAEETCNEQLGIIETRTEVTGTTGVSTSVSQDVKCTERNLEGEGDVAMAEILHGDIPIKSMENGTTTSHMQDSLEIGRQHVTENSTNVPVETEEKLTHALSSPQVHHGDAENLRIPTSTTDDQLEFCKDANFLSGMEVGSERGCDGNSAMETHEETVCDRTTQQHSEDVTGGFLKGETDRSTESQEIVLEEGKTEGKKIMSMAKDLQDYISSVEEAQGRPHNDQHYESLAGVGSDRQAFEEEECIRAASGDDGKLHCSETRSEETIDKVENGTEVREVSNLSKESKGSILCTGGAHKSHEESKSWSNSQHDVSHISKVDSRGNEDGVVKHDLGSTKLFDVESPCMGGEINIGEKSEKPFKDLRGVCESFGEVETRTANQSQKGDANTDLNNHTTSSKGGQIKKVTHHKSELDNDLFLYIQAYFRNFFRNVSQAIAKIFKF